MTRRLMETITAIAASATLALLCGGPAEAATAPVSNPRIIAHFDAAEGQTPEDVAVEPDGTADVSLSQASQVVQVSLDGHVTLLGQLSAGGACPSAGFSGTVGIARAHDGAVYVVECSGNANTGIWRLRRGAAPVQIAQLPANGFPNDMALDDTTGDLYVADSVLGVVYKVPTRGGAPSVWASGTALQPTTSLGANGIAVHDGAVWVSNTSQGTIVKIPIRADGSAGPILTAVTGLSGGVDNFTVVGSDDTIIAVQLAADQVVLIKPGQQPQVVLTAADGLSNPTDVAIRDQTLYVTNGSYIHRNDPNLLVAHIDLH